MNLQEELTKLSLSELTTLLLPVFDKKVKNMTPQQLLARYDSNKFTHPAEISPEIMNALSNQLFAIASRTGSEALLLSPVEPLGACSVVGPVSQNKIMTALRGTEVAADPTNMLALETASRIKKGILNTTASISYPDLCTVHRILRAQPFEGDFRPHFSPFCRTTSGIDTGSYTFEKQALTLHITMCRDILREILGATTAIHFEARNGYTDTPGLITSIRDHLTPLFPDISFTASHTDSGNTYYKGLQFYITAIRDKTRIPVGEGGFTDWTQQLTGNKKQRLLICGIGLDLLIKKILNEPTPMI